MDKTNELTRKCILFSIEKIKNCIQETANEDELSKLSECIKTLSEAYKNIK